MDIFQVYEDEEKQSLSSDFSLQDILGHDMDDFSKDIFISKEIKDKYFKIKHTKLPNGSIMISILDASK